MSMVVEKVRGLASALLARIQEPRSIDYLGAAIGGYAFTKWNIKGESGSRKVTINNPVGITRLAVLGGGIIAAEMLDLPGLRGFVMGALGSTITTAELWRIAKGEYPSPFGAPVLSIGGGDVRAALPPGWRREWLRVVSK